MKIDETVRAILNAEVMKEDRVLAKVEDLVNLVDYLNNLKFSNNSLRQDKVELQKAINKLEDDLELALDSITYTPLDTFV